MGRDNREITTVEIIPQEYCVSVDWLRVTREAYLPSQYFAAPVTQCIASEMSLGYQRQPFRIFDLKGQQVGHVAYAHNDKSNLAEFRGSLAHEWYQYYIGLDIKVTRIDLAITMWFKNYEPHLARVIHAIATKDWLSYGERLGYADPFLMDRQNGCTVYLGSRSSKRFLRIYDKWKRAKEDQYKNAWRFEIEIKGELAPVLWQDIEQGELIEDIAANEILGTMERYGVRISGWDDYGKLRVVPRHGLPSDVESKLSWLQKQVRPAVENLKQRGYGDVAKSILGFDADEL